MQSLRNMSNLTKEQQAHLQVLNSAILYARNASYELKNENLILVADLMDAVHNTPTYIANMYCPSEEYVQLYYAAFDKKHQNSISLVGTFNAALKSA